MKEVKSETVSIRLTPEEKAKLQKLAEDADMSISKYLHKILFKKGD